MPLLKPVPKVARKTITRIFEGSVFKEHFILPGEAPTGSTARIVWLDSAGNQITQVSGVITGRNVTFSSPYSSVSTVPDGAGFYCYVHLATDNSGVEHMICYGTTFKRSH